ncbi:hypothetical protein SteCoe_18596 [Stentor coeruleus]|uniref:Serine aminopeptidase S33 domain-containing protein n=1 Tax=Stentor coeruleus TaxID=5963 RepID=A0A1R2BW37_9CILI|nr:hypothetical protein SteCoe_18596 [Stentor coeruleus]
MLFYIILKFILQIATFPGSFWYWRRTLEKNYSKIISYQLTLRTKELYTFLQNQISSNNSANYCNLPVIIDTIQKTIDNMKNLKKDYKVSECQEKLTSMLENLMEYLAGIKVKYNEKKISLLDWCKDIPCSLESLEFDQETLILPTGIYKELEGLLVNGVKVFGCLDYMRVDLMSKIKCEQIWLDVDSSTKLDCIWVGGSDSATAVILCSPNGGFYEFSYYQTEWLEFYLELGFSVFLWNYRGYGRSQGKASLDRLKKDGEVIVNYIRTQKLSKVLGVHGESLGGCIATYLARECILDFLIADRTFSSLPTVAFYNFGKIAYWMYRLGRGDTSECITDYLTAKCFKVILSDPHDNMISDLSSLKAGVALKIVAPESSLMKIGYLSPDIRKKSEHVLTYSALSSCVESMLRLNQFLNCLTGGEKSYNESEYYRNIRENNYQALNLETDNLQEEDISLCIERLFACLSKVDAGGQLMMDILESSYPELCFIIWLMVLDIWGSSLKSSEEKLSSHIKSITTIRSCLQEMQTIQEEYEKSENLIIQQVFKDFNTIFNIFIEILGFMEDRCGLSSDLDISEDRNNCEYSTAGTLIPLSCGHSGTLNPAEKYMFSKCLLEFLNQECNK